MCILFKASIPSSVQSREEISISCSSSHSSSSQNFEEKRDASNVKFLVSHMSASSSILTKAMKKERVVSPAPYDQGASQLVFQAPLLAQNFVHSILQHNKMSPSWLRSIIIILLAIKIDVVLEHSICLIGILAIRYPAIMGWALVKTLLQTEASASLSLTKSARVGIDNETREKTQNFKENSSPSHSPDDVCRPEMNEYIDAQSDELLSPASFLSIGCEEEADEWGHFTDFCDQSSPFIEESSSVSDNIAMLTDPFNSLEKSLQRRRGEKRSICKLEQLVEEDVNNLEEDDF